MPRRRPADPDVERVVADLRAELRAGIEEALELVFEARGRELARIARRLDALGYKVTLQPAVKVRYTRRRGEEPRLPLTRADRDILAGLGIAAP